ncbi:MAG: transglutaminase domain-containing protein [Oscillospiraceae bacterium]|nr:transglutaminase domain-containing protein [Oscillospiraceae bacterium]
MVKKKIIPALCGTAIAFVIGMACVGCIVTGFDMAVNLWTVALWCAIGALLSGLCFTLPLDLILFSTVAVAGCGLWFAGNMDLSFQAVLYRLTREYNVTYGCGIIRPEHYTAEALEPEIWLFLCFLGMVITIVIAWTVLRRKNTFAGLLPALICFASCFFVRDTVPDAVFLWMFFFGVLLLVLSHTARRNSAFEGNRLILIAAAPLAAFLLILFVAVPQSNYQADAFAQTVMGAVLQNDYVQAIFGDLVKTGNTGSSVDGSVVRLDSVGIRENSQAEVLQVDSGYDGMLYLRGRSLDAYDGKTWTDSRKGTPSLYWPDREQLKSVGEVRIKTRYAHKMLYLPYYVQSIGLEDMTRGMENTKKLTEYSFTTALLPSNALPLTEVEPEISDPDQYRHYTESVAKWAEPMAAEITAEKNSVYEKAQAIKNYVRNSARYDLKTDTMPLGEADFAKWFLEDSDTGYCVHFATAATVLLQAAGIPARYVTGYALQVRENCVSLVRSRHAHAWVEYWLPGFGWAVLEVTPSAQQVPEQPETTPEIEKAPFNWRIVYVIGIVALSAAIVAAFAQRPIRLYLRRKRLYTGTMTARVLAYWQEAERFAACLRETPGEELLTIAEKAKFSRHAPQEEDLQPFLDYLEGAKQRIRRHGLFRKLYYRFVLALY